MTPTHAPPSAPGSASAERTAQMIVDFVLDYVERAGTIAGGRKRRVLMLNGGSVNLRTGEITPHVETMVRDVAKIITGEATYKRKAGA